MHASVADDALPEDEELPLDAADELPAAVLVADDAAAADDVAPEDDAPALDAAADDDDAAPVLADDVDDDDKEPPTDDVPPTEELAALEPLDVVAPALEDAVADDALDVLVPVPEDAPATDDAARELLPLVLACDEDDAPEVPMNPASAPPDDVEPPLALPVHAAATTATITQPERRAKRRTRDVPTTRFRAPGPSTPVAAATMRTPPGCHQHRAPIAPRLW